MPNNDLSRRSMLKTALAGVAGLSSATLLAGCGQDRRDAVTRNTTVPGTKNLSLQLAWLANVQSAGEIAADKLGYFKEVGLTVATRPGGPNANPIPLVAGGNSLVGITYAPALMLARSQDIPVRCFGAAMQKAPLAYFSLKSSGITSVSQYKGKKIGVQVGGEPLLSALLRKNGLDLSDVELVKVGADTTPLITGQVDLFAAWVLNLQQLAPAKEKGLNHQTLWDNGVRIQSNYYIATEETLTNRRDELVAFLEAVSKGWAYAIDNPQQAVDMVAETAPGLQKKHELEEIKTLLPGFLYGPQTQQHGWGWMDKALWESALSEYQQLGVLKKPVSVDEIATWEVLNGATGRVRR
ncbi:ABC transporter substrate-binding protein [Streptosporangium amethystogenes subsp. fukuiense]|uniref:ABC transporter substrate-binding protein n=1 Tax=Streptosporangium amethystogenes TaxID=2002 RepID=UPI0033745CB7